MSQKLIEKKWFRVTLVFVSVIGMATLAIYQRKTGPSYPVSVDTTLGSAEVSGELPRSHGGEGGAEIDLAAPEGVTGEVRWRRFPTDEAWQSLELERQGDSLTATLPHQPPAGKLEYSVRLANEGENLVLPTDEAAVIRYRADVPGWVLVPHILCMFIALAIVLRSALGALLGESEVGRFAPWVLGFLIPGGFVLGPLVQKYAFDAFWTGWPFGADWTDNKTLGALLAWILVLAVRRWKPELVRWAVLFAAAVMMAVYLIPHSIHGSELEWTEIEATSEMAPAAAAALQAADEKTGMVPAADGDGGAGGQSE